MSPNNPLSEEVEKIREISETHYYCCDAPGDGPRAIETLLAAYDAVVKELTAARATLRECEDYFDNCADVVDGSYGEPRPNKEMMLLEEVRAALSPVSP